MAEAHPSRGAIKSFICDYWLATAVMWPSDLVPVLINEHGSLLPWIACKVVLDEVPEESDLQLGSVQLMVFAPSAAGDLIDALTVSLGELLGERHVEDASLVVKLLTPDLSAVTLAESSTPKGTWKVRNVTVPFWCAARSQA